MLFRSRCAPTLNRAERGAEGTAEPTSLIPTLFQPYSTRKWKTKPMTAMGLARISAKSVRATLAVSAAGHFLGQAQANQPLEKAMSRGNGLVISPLGLAEPEGIGKALVCGLLVFVRKERRVEQRALVAQRLAVVVPTAAQEEGADFPASAGLSAQHGQRTPAPERLSR